jgi:hypothetical protein
MEGELSLRIVLEGPPKGVDFGLQCGRGKDYEIVQKQRSNGQDLAFTLSVGVKAGSTASAPTLVGPFAQGPPAERFVYVGIGTYAGQKDTPWSRRLKVPLGGITMAMIKSQAVLEARIPGTAKDGGPSCATVRPIGGWKLQTRS